MLREFLDDLKDTYETILNGEDKVFKFIDKWSIDGYIGEFYERIKNKEERKTTGSFYTPKEIVDFIAKDLSHKIENLTDIKILDPSCGGDIF
ncbi:N-6 DNA methylase [Caloramator sp. mosi_1]|uniref:N-6 DNA methylase n=1 Tax=Caloramator sp. mosi_1 TaxID=3023090 RepID=UPI00235E9F8C|nr:N-6 DNA methylase [Caloramator sp. mosi_1]WDC83673.1 N-6 DNA methylase [Caloramator sp. mosi_1]